MALESEAPCDGALLSHFSCLSLASPFPAKSALKPPPDCGVREPRRSAAATGGCRAYSLQGLKYLCEKQFQKRVVHLSVRGRVGPSWAAAWVRAAPLFSKRKLRGKPRQGLRSYTRSVTRCFSVFVKVGFQERGSPNYTFPRGKEMESQFSSRPHLCKYRAAPQQSIELLLPVLVEMGKIWPC